MDAINQQRAFVYDLLAGLLSAPPTDDGLNALFEWADHSQDSGFLEPLQSWLRGHLPEASQPDAVKESIHQNHASLLTGISESFGPKPPYECMFTSESAPDIGTARREMRVLCQAFQIQVSDPYGQTSDHITCQLQTMRNLAQADRDNLFQLTMCGRILRWVKRWHHALQQKAPDSFYCALAETLTLFLQFDSQHLQQRVSCTPQWPSNSRTHLSPSHGLAR